VDDVAEVQALVNQFGYAVFAAGPSAVWPTILAGSKLKSDLSSLHADRPAPVSPTGARTAWSRTYGSLQAPPWGTSCPCSASFTVARGSLARRSRTTVRRSPPNITSSTPPSPTAPGRSALWPSKKTRRLRGPPVTGVCSTCSRACAGCSGRWPPSVATQTGSLFTANRRAGMRSNCIT